MVIDRKLCRAFSLIELLVVISIIALLMSILLPALAAARRTARMAVCSANLQQFGRSYSTYANDFKELIGALNGDINDPLAVEQHTEHPVIARHARAVINASDERRLKPIKTFADAGGLCVAERYEHLALIGYVSQDAVMPVAACPEDRAMLEWRAQPFATTSWRNAPKNIVNRTNMEWLPYSSSYQLTPAAAAYTFFTWDARSWAAYTQGAEHNLYNLWKVRFGRRRTNEVAFPSTKVAMMDTQQRHVDTDLFYAYPQARQPLLFWDGSVSMRKTADANEGWLPQLPEQKGATKYLYSPDAGFESPPISSDERMMTGYYRWTRGGLHGVDFSGSEAGGTIGEARPYYGN